MRFSREKFFEGTRNYLGGLSPQQVNGINFILDSMELDPFLTRIEWAAYMFATVYPETAHTFQPIHEYGGHNYFVRRYGSQTKVGRRLGNDTPEEGAIYAGIGDVQLTGETNFEQAEIALRREYPELVRQFEARTGRKFDLTVGDQPNDQNDPANAGDPAIAYAIMSYGMRTGMFGGGGFKHWTKPNGFDAVGARHLVNGTDNAEMIAGYYQHWLVILRNSLITSSAAASMPDPVGSTASAGNQGAPASAPAGSQTGQPASEQLPPIIPSAAIPASPEVQSALSDPNVSDDSVTIVPQVSATTDDTPPQTGIRASIAGAITWITTSGAGVIAVFSGVKVEIVLGLAAAAVIIGIIFVWKKFDSANKNAALNATAAEADKQRAHEVQMAMLNSAAQKDLNTVRVMPLPLADAPAETAPLIQQ